MSLPLPLPEPPADAVADLLDLFREARREHAGARRLCELLAMDYPGRPDDAALTPPARLVIEQRVAELRAELWTTELGRLAAELLAHGVNVSTDQL